MLCIFEGTRLFLLSLFVVFLYTSKVKSITALTRHFLGIMTSHFTQFCIQLKMKTSLKAVEYLKNNMTF